MNKIPLSVVALAAVSVSATAADLKQAANDSATEELDKLGKQRKKECE